MREVEKKETFSDRIAASPHHDKTMLLSCSACGANPQRASAKCCQVCGQELGEDYEPLGALLASYNLRRDAIKTSLRQTENEMPALFDVNKNNAASTATAFLVYSLVPYLGILFCPGTLLMGSIGLAMSYQKPGLGGRETAGYNLLFGAIVLVVQILLWWLFFNVPELDKNI